MKSVCFVGGMRAVIVLLKEGKKSYNIICYDDQKSKTYAAKSTLL